MAVKYWKPALLGAVTAAVALAAAVTVSQSDAQAATVVVYKSPT